MTNAIENIKAPKAMKAIEISDLHKSEADIMKALRSVQTRGQSLQRDVHIAACSVLQRLDKNNDVRLVTNLFTALPQSYRTNALREWFTAFGPITFEKNKAVYTKRGPTSGKVDLYKAMATPFWEFAPEPEYKPVDVTKLIDAAIKKLTTDQDKTGKHHGATIAALEAAKEAGKAPAETQNA